MKFIKLDTIVRSILAQKGLSIHYYWQYLKLSADCLRELNFDVLQPVMTVALKVNEYGAIKLPCDYVDFVSVGVGVGSRVRKMVIDDKINRMNNLDADNNKIPHVYIEDIGYFTGGSWIYSNYNQNGENTGGYFGVGQSSVADGFKELRERGEIQLGAGFFGSTVILEYISDGSACNAACRIHPYAQRTIESYADWKNSPNRANNNSPEGQGFHNQLRILRGRMNPLGIEDIKRIMNRNKIATPK